MSRHGAGYEHQQGNGYNASNDVCRLVDDGIELVHELASIWHGSTSVGPRQAAAVSVAVVPS
jgi:hypothetical protein